MDIDLDSPTTGAEKTEVAEKTARRREKIRILVEREGVGRRAIERVGLGVRSFYRCFACFNTVILSFQQKFSSAHGALGGTGYNKVEAAGR